MNEHVWFTRFYIYFWTSVRSNIDTLMNVSRISGRPQQLRLEPPTFILVEAPPPRVPLYHFVLLVVIKFALWEMFPACQRKTDPSWLLLLQFVLSGLFCRNICRNICRNFLCWVLRLAVFWLHMRKLLTCSCVFKPLKLWFSNIFSLNLCFFF